MSAITFKELEKTKYSNIFSRKIITLSFNEYKKRVLENDSTLIESLFYGSTYIVKGFHNKELLIKIKKEIHQWGIKKEPSFHQMKEGVPNFHRIINKNPLYNIQSKVHGYYFFNFNKNPWGLFNLTKEQFLLKQKIMGFGNKDFTQNTPKDGIIDRLWLFQYPQGGGFIQSHDHTQDIDSLANIIIMSQKNKDYNSGGVYLIDEHANKIYVDDGLEVGDLIVIYKKQLHGVEPVDPGITTDWSSEKGRWMMVRANIKSDQ